MPANSSLEGAPIVPTQPWNLSDSDPYTVQDGSVLPKTLALSTKIPTQQDTAATYSNSGATIESVVPYLTCRGTGPAQVFAGSRPSPQNPFQISCQETSVSGQPDAMEYSVSGSGTVRELLSPFTIPPDHYAMIYLDNMGQLKVVESLSIREHGTFFSSELREKFLGRLVLRNLGYHGLPPPSDTFSHPQDMSNYRQVKRRRGSAYDRAWEMFSERLSNPVKAPQSAVEGASDYFSESTEKIPQSVIKNTVAFTIGDTEKVLAFYESTLEMFNQENCESLIQAFISVIEPCKRVFYPYNGRLAVGQPRDDWDPERTKPPWWPAGILHIEPHHLRKNDRIDLLINILRTSNEYGVTLDNLQEATQRFKRRLRPEKTAILNDIFKLRRLEEQLERGEIDPDTTYTATHIRRRTSRPVRQPLPDIVNRQVELSESKRKAASKRRHSDAIASTFGA
ncbi:hypothetical protein LV164_001527 [Aspergillus fumigatus]|nr:hypothetical protein KXX42_004720 [Aspergillus fumigatus]KAH1544904.1 hypothetical protein KXX57_005156 [Aspergillus fumigatus]KAH2301143.1 hypothetical protein KXV47_002441 [Aspergillus fumigatus]KAH2669429.1 hypothetical protein KXV32_004176 [Aspergillus fumigatus]KAH2908528.1 hypothetical protein KXW25_004729 [Aspergillus fumigatus]